MIVPFRDRDIEIETTGSDGPDNVAEARFGRALLPSCYHWLMGAEPIRQLSLGDSSAATRLDYELTSHGKRITE